MKSATARHVKYAQGYAELHLFSEAREELAKIDLRDEALPEVLAAYVTVEWEAKEWKTLVGYGRELARRAPQEERGWIAWAFALRELGKVVDAKAVLLEAEPLHGSTAAVLHYNLGCYHCLLGEFAEARQRLARAFRMHPSFKADASSDPDLEALWAELGA